MYPKNYKPAEFQYPPVNEEVVGLRISENKSQQNELLNLGYAVLEDLPDEVFEFRWLKKLFLSENNFTCLSEKIIKLVNLEKLWLARNPRFEKFPKEVLQLKNLKELQIGGSRRGLPAKITEIPAGISNLSLLEKLDLGNNRIKIIPSELFDLPELKELVLYGNLIEELPEAIINAKKLEIIRLDGNPLKKPPLEIALQGINAIKDWFQSPKVENNEIKLILTGNSTAGKTSLVNFLTKNEYFESISSTHGIQINRWEIDKLNINIWDFGGQEYFHTTHRLFLTSNSVYVLLWEKSKNKTELIPTKIKIEGKKDVEVVELQHYDYNHWLKIIRKFTGRAENSSPILMVQNKIDDAENGNELEITKSNILEDYRVTGDFHFSIKEAFIQQNRETTFDFQFRIFRNELLAILKETAKGIEIQQYIANVREAIRAKKTDNIISWDDYEKFSYAAAQAKMNEKKMEILTRYLHNTGIVIYYGFDSQFDNTILKDTVFLNPHFVTQSIYKILNQEVKKANGQFTRLQAVEVIGDQQTADRIIELMRSNNFELIFSYDKHPETFYATAYLPDNYPGSEDDFGFAVAELYPALALKFHEFFSLSFFSRFLSVFGNYAENRKIWKYGIFLTKYEKRVFIECLFDKRTILVKTGETDKHIELIKEIFDEFCRIIGDTDFEISRDGLHFVSWNMLKINRKDNIPTFRYGKEKINIAEFLYLFDDKEIKLEKRMTHKEYIQNLLSSGNLEKAIIELLYGAKQSKNNDLYNSMILQSSRFKSNEKDQADNVVPNDEYRREKAKIIQAISFYLNEYNPSDTFIWNEEETITERFGNEIPEFFISEMKKQLNDEYEKMQRFNSLLSNMKDESLRKEYEDELAFCEENIDRIEKRFLNKINQRKPEINAEIVLKMIDDIKQTINNNYITFNVTNNNMQIDGNGNIVIQGVKESTISVNVNDAGKIEELLGLFDDKMAAQLKQLVEEFKKNPQKVINQNANKIYNIDKIDNAKFE